ncbi:hypothetical protein BGX24_004719, partial [Mortierella sp. AD032]
VEEYNTYTISNLNGVMQPGPVYAAPFYDYGTMYTSTSAYNITLKTHAVDGNFVGVGGHLAGQDPFVIGLTSKGVYEFDINSKNNSNPIGVMGVLITAPGYFGSPGPITMTIYGSQNVGSYQPGHIETWGIIMICLASMIACMIIVTIVRGCRGKGGAVLRSNNNNSDAVDGSGRRIAQEFAMVTLTPRTGHASGVDGRSSGARTGPAATPTPLHPSITNADIVAYENEVLSNADLSNNPPPESVPSPDEESDHTLPATVAAADALPTYEDDGQVPEYSRDPQQPEIVIPISGA